MAAAVENPRARPRIVLAVGVLAAAYLATRIALIWRFPWFVDETTFASFARDVHGDFSMLFIAESDKKGLLPSWLGAGLIGAGFDPVTAMRLLAAGGGALAAACGGLVIRRFYGLREGLLTAVLIALGPFFLVTASVGIYDAMVAGLVAASVMVSIRLAQQPRPYTALLLGLCLGAGALTKPTAWAAAVVVPFTLLVFDHTSPQRRRRLLVWAANAMLALGLGYAIASIARLTPLHDQPIPQENQRELGDVLANFVVIVETNGTAILGALIGYVTLPLLVIAIAGGIVAWRRNRPAATILIVLTIAVLVSSVLLPLRPNPRYFAAAIVPLAGFAAIGGFAGWDFVASRFRQRPALGRIAACAIAAVVLLPAAVFNTSVLADPTRATYPGLDQDQYVTRPAALTPLGTVVREIERRGGPYPVHIDVGLGYPWGLDLALNGAAVGSERRYDVYSYATPKQLAAARYLISDGEPSDAPPRPGFRLLRRIERPAGGAVMRLYARVRS